MSAVDPQPDDLRTIAANLKAEGHHSRAEVISNTADKLEAALDKAERYTAYGRAVFSLWEIRNNMDATYATLAKNIVKRAMAKEPAALKDAK